MPTRKLIQAINEESRLMLPTTTPSCKYRLIGLSYICYYAKKGDLCVLKGLEGLGDRPGSGGGCVMCGESMGLRFRDAGVQMPPPAQVPGSEL